MAFRETRTVRVVRTGKRLGDEMRHRENKTTQTHQRQSNAQHRRFGMATAKIAHWYAEQHVAKVVKLKKKATILRGKYPNDC